MSLSIRLFIRFIVAMSLAILVVGAGLPARAQQPGTDAGVIAQESLDLDKAETRLNAIREQVERFRTDDGRLVDLRVELEALNRSILSISAAMRPRLETTNASLATLGDPPADGTESEIVVSERQRLTNQRNEINALIGEAEALAIEATRVAGVVTQIRRQLFTDAILRRTEISAKLFTDASRAFAVELGNLSQAVSSWLEFVWNFKRMSLFGAIFLSLAAALVFLSGSYRLFAPLITRELSQTRPDYITRLSVAFFSTIIPTAAAAAFAASSYFFLERFNVLRPDIAPLVGLLLGVSLAVYFVSLLSNAVLSPRDGNWRLVRVSDRGALLLSIAIFVMALVNGADYLLGGVSEVLGSPVVLTVVKSFAASIIIGLVLIAMTFIRPVLHKGEAPASPGRPWPRAIVAALLLTGVGLILSAILGYVGLARFAANQIVVTSAIVVTMYIGILSGRAVSAQHAFAETRAGRALERRFGLGEVALDQAGLLAGLAIYVLVFVLFIPLVLLQWGFQVADVQSWAYRIFTEIRIGSISISLVGILAGIFLFALGYFITRWFQKWLDSSVLARSQVDAGVRNSVSTAVGYAGMVLAGLVGISAAGINLSSLALVAGALSLGIGFGLQNIVSNFVSGLILLAERPFKVGDWVVAGATEGFVRRISVRATEIETFQRQTVLVPNSVLIGGNVGNWTHRNKLGRIDIPFSVHGSNDPRRVIEVLLDAVRAQPGLLRNPEPVVVFLNFSPATLDLEVRVFLADVLNATTARTELRVAVFERFRDEGIAIGGPAAPEVPIKIDPQSAELISAIIENAKASLDGGEKPRQGGAITDTA